MKRISVLILAMVICLGGCTMIPPYRRPNAPISEHWPSGEAYLQTTPQENSQLDVRQLEWREFFNDSKLQQVIEMAFNNNRDLRLAVLNMENARALYGVQRANLLPTVNVAAGLNKQRYSSDFLASTASKEVEKYSVDLGITAWEVDFFGRIRSLKKQALEEYLGTKEARRSAQIALVYEVVKAYLTIAADRSNLNLVKSILKTQEGVYNLAQRKYKLKLINEIDLYRAKTQMDTAYADVVRYTQQEALDHNALNLLAGELVPEDLLPSDLESVSPLKDLSAGLSSQVLLKRPDIMEAEHQLKGAYANIGAARAAFFPSISLTTILGTASNEFSGLFKAGRNTWTYAPQIVMPIFDARTWSAYRVSESTRQIALAQYEKVIQTAFREVADVLAVQGTVDKQIMGEQSIVDSAQKIYDLSSKRYANGIDSYLSVLDAQRSLYSAKLGLIFAKFSKLANQAKAYAVLGGGGLDEQEASKQDNRGSFQDKILSLLDFEFKRMDAE